MVARRKENGKETVGASGRDRILDAAEHLFARHGFYGVSVRDTTKAAAVDVALVSYHFGGKRELFAAAGFQALCAATSRRGGSGR